MASQDDKRLLRKLKRVIKRNGAKHRRHDLKQKLRDHPEEAHDDVENLGRNESRNMNGLDRPVGD